MCVCVNVENALVVEQVKKEREKNFKGKKISKYFKVCTKIQSMKKDELTNPWRNQSLKTNCEKLIKLHNTSINNYIIKHNTVIYLMILYTN